MDSTFLRKTSGGSGFDNEGDGLAAREGYKKAVERFNYKEYHRWMNQQLSDRITSLAVALLGNPPYKRPGEWRYGEKHHLLINVSGERQGYWYDFKTGEHGDALQLAQNQTGYKGRDLSNWVKSFIGYSFHKTEPKTDGNGWKPIIPVPFEVTGSKHYEHLLREFSYRGLRQTMRHIYRDQEGNLIGYVIRLEGNGRKMTLPLTYCSNAIGQKAWRWKGFPTPRLPYGVELLNSSGKPVLIVEGEKTADAESVQVTVSKANY